MPRSSTRPLLRRYAPLLIAAALLTVVAAAEPRYVIVLAVPAGVTAVAVMLAGRRDTRLHNVCRAAALRRPAPRHGAVS